MEHAKQIESRTNGNARVYKVYSIVEKPGNEKNIWLDIGVGRLNRDDSISCKLDCIPLNGTLHIRPYDNRKQGSINNHFNSGRSEGGFQ